MPTQLKPNLPLKSSDVITPKVQVVRRHYIGFILSVYREKPILHYPKHLLSSKVWSTQPENCLLPYEEKSLVKPIQPNAWKALDKYSASHLSFPCLFVYDEHEIENPAFTLIEAWLEKPDQKVFCLEVKKEKPETSPIKGWHPITSTFPYFSIPIRIPVNFNSIAGYAESSIPPFILSIVKEQPLEPNPPKLTQEKAL